MNDTLNSVCDDPECGCGGSSVVVVSNNIPDEIIGPTFEVQTPDFEVNSVPLDRGQYRIRMVVTAEPGSSPPLFVENQMIRLPATQLGEDTGEYKRVFVYKVDVKIPDAANPDRIEVTAVVRLIDNPVFIPVLIGAIATLAIGTVGFVSFGGVEKFKEATTDIFNVLLVAAAVFAGILVFQS